MVNGNGKWKLGREGWIVRDGGKGDEEGVDGEKGKLYTHHVTHITIQSIT